MSIRNPYVVLEVTRSATAAELKAAYKRLAFKHHPDRNHGAAYHTERFKDIVEAYDILSDPDKRARFDRLYFTSNTQTFAKAHPQPSGPSAYGHRTGYDPFQDVGTNQPSSNTFTGRGGRRYTYASPHQIFIALFLLACTATGSLWMGALMDRNTARNRLAEGDYISAIEYDSTYGEAWFALAENQLSKGYYVNAAYNMDRAFRLVDDIPLSWYWHRGRVAEHLGEMSIASGFYGTFMVHTGLKENGDTLDLLDSCKYRLACLLLLNNVNPDSSYKIIKSVSTKAALSPTFMYIRGLAALEAGYFSESVKELQAAADASFRPGESYYYLGHAYLAMADTAVACKAWDIALTSGSTKADSLMRKYCTFEQHTTQPSSLTIYVKP